MAKPQVSQSFWKRLGGWMRRHKVRAGFSIFVLFFLLFIVEGWVQTQISIHFERERFEATSRKFHDLSDQLRAIGSPKITPIDECVYSSDGGVFSSKNRGCATDVDIVYVGISKSDARSRIVDIESIVKRNGLSLNNNSRAYDGYDIKVDDFTLNKLSCVLSAAYYSDSIVAEERDSRAPAHGEVLFIDIGCSGAAQAEYFPVQQS